jgi:two-component system chemotaxis response regulator CheY
MDPLLTSFWYANCSNFREKVPHGLIRHMQRKEGNMNNVKVPRVLIADDEKHMRLLMKTALKKMKYDVAGEASNGEEVVKLFKEIQPDLTLLDINMPFKTGEEALEEILDQNRDALVIMLTSVVDSETVQKCIERGAANYIRKDTPLPEIAKIIHQTWKESQ